MKITPGAVADPRTTRVNKTGSWRTFMPVIDYEECTGCGTCATFCPEGCVEEVEQKRFEPDLDYCKGCGICANECPVDAIEMEREAK